MGPKGVSPLVAVAVLIALTMASAVIIIIWTQGLIGGRLEEARETGTRALNCLGVRLRADSASYNDAEDSVRAVIRNIGNADITDFRLIVYYESDPIFPNEFTPPNAVEKLAPGGLLVLTANGVNQRPAKLLIEGYWKRDQCPDIQPLYECKYVGGDFVC